MTKPLRILALQPYFNGSHSQFHECWVRHSVHTWTTLSLPARNWKWRMRHASIHFVKEISKLVETGQSWDAIFCTDMLNVAEFRGLIASNPTLRAALSDVPVVLYFHENQFAYPIRKNFKPDQHFPFTNFISALSADRIWFNSRFNFESMFDGLKRHAKRWPDFVPTEAIESLPARAEVQPPGVETPPLDLAPYRIQRQQRAESGQPVRIIWAARWEHDKNVDDLRAALRILTADEIPFQLSLIGQAFHNTDPVFEEIGSEFANQILRWGFQERDEYWKALAESDVFVSTANHEFFGLSCAEAIAAGVRPLFPNRLAYPELLSYAGESVKENSADAPNANQLISPYLYDGTPAGLANSLKSIIHQRSAGNTLNQFTQSKQFLDCLNWPQRAAELDTALTKRNAI